MITIAPHLSVSHPEGRFLEIDLTQSVTDLDPLLVYNL